MDATRKRNIGLAAVGSAALVAAGTAFAAGKLSHSGAKANAASGSGDLVAASTQSGGADARGYGFGRRGGGFDRFGFGRMGGPFHRGDDLAAAATYLGTTAGDLQSKLAAGQTLAQIADATNGKSASGLIDALVTHEKTELQQAVTDGKLTQTQADQLETNLTDRITALVNGTKPTGPGGHFGIGPFHRGDDLAAAATYLGTTASDLQSKLAAGQTLAQIADATNGKSASGLIDALVTHEKTELQQAVTDGKLTQTQADQLETNLTDRITALVNGTKPTGPGGHFGIGPFHRGDDLAAAATYLGTTASDLQSKLAAGQTLAQIADATSGKSASGLIDALVTHEKTELQQAVTDGKLTQTQADQLETNLTDRITALVNGTRPTGPGPGFGFRFRGGGGPWQGPPTQRQNAPATHI